jgi:4-hydroxythreonine-4-phosphate dehydrogenase
MMKKPKIAISMGDPGGIGPEVGLKAIDDRRVRQACRPVLIGDLRLLRHIGKVLGLPGRIVPADSPGPPGPDEIIVLDVVRMRTRPSWGQPSAAGGKLAGKAIEAAVGLAVSGAAAGMVTAPVSKESLARAGYGMVGHTELIARLTKTKSYAMMITRGRLRVVFATTHLPLRQVARRLTRQGIMEKILLTRKYLALYMGIDRARIGVTCLNPHCGERGFLGQEESNIIEPAMEMARSQGICVEGPYSADAIYRRDLASRFDAVVAMYHDQGMIPLKQRGHDEVVNITLGPPVVRTSPGHGTAFDLAGTGTASHGSMVRAILECTRIAKRVGDGA